jgi:hypothetical protein
LYFSILIHYISLPFSPHNNFAKQIILFIIMKASLILPIAIQAVRVMANCNSPPGLANGQCVRYYRGRDCINDAAHIRGSYSPNCGGSCYQFDSFESIEVHGDGFFGTNCVVYADINCQQRIGETGNQVSVGGVTTCLSLTGSAKSMKCFWRC